MIVKRTVCDICGTRMDYEGRGDAGLTLAGEVKFNSHIPDSTGHASVKISAIDQHHVCSPKCLFEIFDEIHLEFKEAWSKRDVDIEDGKRVTKEIP